MDIKSKPHICPDVNCNEIAVALEVVVDGKMAWFPPTGKPFWVDDKAPISEEIVKTVLERPEECWKPGCFKRYEPEANKDA